MNDKLKLPLTAVFSFLLGGVVFFPWGSNDRASNERANDSILTSIVDRVKNKNGDSPVLVVNKVDYHFSDSDIKISNLAIENQLKNSNAVTEQAVIATRKMIKVTPTIIVEYRFSKDEVQLSNIAIKEQLKNFNIEEIAVDNTNELENILVKIDSGDVKSIVEVKKQFSEDELQISNLAIKKQLNNFEGTEDKKDEKPKDNNQEGNAEIVLDETDDSQNKILKVDYKFSPKELVLSNLAIKKQLDSYIDISDEDETKKVNINNTDEFEISEKSESDLLVENTSNYDNETDSQEIIEAKKINTKDYEPAKFSESELKISNLAILKQLRSYDYDEVSHDDSTIPLTTVEITPEITNESVDENESDLLMSNSARDINDSKSELTVKSESRKKSSKSQLTSLTDDDFQDDSHEQEDEDEDDDDDEYGGKRVEFKDEPDYFTDSYEKKSTLKIKGKIKIPGVEDIVEHEIIEEIEISDDGKVIASSVNN